MAIETTIMEALFERLKVMPDRLPIAWPNTNFTAPTTNRFLRVQFIPNQTERRFIGSNEPHLYYGLLQVSVMWGQNEGETLPRNAAAQIVSHFPTDLSLSRDGLSVRITKRPALADLMIDGSRVQIPVTIEWECLA